MMKEVPCVFQNTFVLVIMNTLDLLTLTLTMLTQNHGWISGSFSRYRQPVNIDTF